MKDVIFCSYCFTNEASGGDYRAQQVRLKESIYKVYLDANFHFQFETEAIGKPKFQQSLYGFKVRLINECLAMGYKKIIFFDTAITLVNKVDYWFEIIKDYGVLAIADNRSLDTTISDKLREDCKLSQDILSEIKLVGGSVYVFDFDIPKCQAIFNAWEDMEASGYFGTQDDLSNNRLQGHRMDETCMALAFYLCGNKPVGYGDLRYGYINPTSGKITSVTEELTILKRHFK